MIQTFTHPRLLARVLLLCAPGVLGCGNPGPPAPPSLLLPQPVGDLSVQRTADTVILRWTMPQRSTDRVPLHGEQHVVVCRALGDAACTPAGTLAAKPGAVASFTDPLPAGLRTGAPRLLSYFVRIENPRGADAGASNPAYTAAGEAPPPVRDASANATVHGVVIHWTAAGRTDPSTGRVLARLNRRDEASERNGPADPVVLEAPLNQAWLPAEVLDRTAADSRRYTYRVGIVEQLQLSGHTLEIAGASADTPALLVKDTFAPEPPKSLAAAANPEGRTSDLSWPPGSEADLAGYFVYRRFASQGGEAVRISGPKPVPEPGWSDTSAVPGTRYAYSVSAVDASGNESARSGEAVETLP